MSKEDKRTRIEWLKAEYEKMGNDPLVKTDIEEVMEDFKYADAESAQMIDKDEGLWYD